MIPSLSVLKNNILEINNQIDNQITEKTIVKDLKNLLTAKLLLLCVGIFLTSYGDIKSQNQSIIQGYVKDSNFLNYSIDSAKITGINKNNNQLLFEVYSSNGFYNVVVNKVEEVNEVVNNFSLGQNFPNPFNPMTNFEINILEPGNYLLEFYEITGKEIFRKEIELGVGTYNFNVSGLGSAGVKFYRITGNKGSITKKMIQLDGSEFNPQTRISNSKISSINKGNNLELRIIAEKQGYLKDSVDVSYIIGSTNNLNFLLSQIPKEDTIWIHSTLNLIPTNTAADNATIKANGNVIGTTNNAGQNTSFVLVQYVTNPLDSTDKKYFPATISLSASRINTQNVYSNFLVDGSDIIWNANMQQLLINKNGNANGKVQNNVGEPIINANIKLYNNDNNNLLGEGNTDNLGNYFFNYTYQGYEKDPNDMHTPINALKKQATANSYEPKTIIKPFTNPVITNFVLNKLPYEFNATIKLYNTKGDIITDLDSLKLTWPDGTNQGFANNNGIVQINKLLYTLNSDTTAIITHNQPQLYLKWIMGTTNNPNRVELLYQNPGPGPNTIAKMPLNQVNNKITEIYLIPKQAKYGPNNDLLIDMGGPVVTGMLARGPAGIVSGFRPVPFDTTYILQFTFNSMTGAPIPQNHVNRAFNQIQKFFDALNAWSHKKILNYEFVQIDSYNHPLWQWIVNGPRNIDNFSYSHFYSAPPGNAVHLNYTDGTFRIRYSDSGYSIGTTDGGIQEEFFCSMTNTEIDGPTYILSSNIAGMPYTDLARHLMGISLIMKTGTYYNQ